MARRSSVAGMLVAIAATVAAACERTEPDRGAAATAVHHPEAEPAATPTATATATATASAAPTRCVVPMSETPAPVATAAPVCPDDPSPPPPMPRGWVDFPDAPGQPRIAVEIADTGPSREHGLMYRKSMPAEQGMIFTWLTEDDRAFWMHNTCLPLDMLFIAADGTIAGILEQVPSMNDAPRGVPCPVLQVLEVNAGWARAHGVAPGQHLRLET